VQFAGVQLAPDEVLTIAENLRDLVERMVADPNSESELRAWFPTEDYRQRLTEAQMNVKQNGTAQRRPLGRSVVFRDIQRGPGESEIWKHIIEPLRALYEEGQTQVIIIGSLAGGAGGGALFDVAYTVRRTTRSFTKEGIPLSAFLVTDTPFGQLNRSPQLKINAMGALREVGRFLLAKGRPYPMTYRRNTRDAVLNGYAEWSLFDDCYLFDGERPMHGLTRWAPQYALFPMIADVVTVLLDRLDPNRRTKERPLREYRNNMSVQIAEEQLRRAEPIVSSYGAFTYRLPIRDIVAALQARFARDLLRLFLTGPDYTADQVVLDTKQNGEDLGGTPVQLAYRLMGSVSPLSRVLAQIEETGWTPVLTSQLATVLSGTSIQSERFTFRRELNALVMRVLNGSEHASIVVARTGKLGYARELLRQLSAMLDHAHAQMGLFQARMSADQPAIDLLRQVVEAYRQEVAQEIGRAHV
jgi:hypothetical protein